MDLGIEITRESIAIATPIPTPTPKISRQSIHVRRNLPRKTAEAVA
jgi:hypothetical protein